MKRYFNLVPGETSTKQDVNYFTEKNKNIIIKFNEILSDEKLSVYNTFKMSIGKKRIYANYANAMCKDNNKILALDTNNARQVIFAYFNIKKAIDNKLFTKIDDVKDLSKYGVDARRDFGKYENFINFMITTLFTSTFINIVKDYVEKHYKNPVDEKASKNYAPGTTFTNEQFKLLHTISILTKFAIPLCTHYIYVNSDKNIEVFSFMYTCFDAIFKIVTVGTNCTDLMGKLYQYVDRLVRRTEPSNKLIWANFPMYNDTRESITDDLIIKIVTSILPKFDLNKIIINLISVVIRQSVGKYKIKAKNPYDCYRINDNDNSNDDEDALSESDIFDMFYRNIDESILILNRYGNDDAIDTICKRNNIYISEDEFIWYKEHYRLHNFTVKVVTMVFARFFSGSINVRSCTFDQMIKLMIVLVKKMQDLGINYLPHFVTAIRESYTFTNMPSAAILKNLKNNIDYIQLIEMKYKYIQSVFEIKTTASDENNPIKDMIVSLVHNDYLYNEYGRDDINGTPIQISEENIINDVIQLYKMMVI
jgi:hypothetical protein